MDEERKRLFYIPGDFTPARYQHHSRELLLQQYLNPKYEERKRAGFPTLADGFSKEPDKSNIYEYKPVDEVDLDKDKDMWSEKCHYKSIYIPKKTECVCNPKETKKERNMCSKLKRIPSTVINAMKNFELAKRLHKENLEHHPLPEVITDAMYQKLQYQRAKEPGLALKDEKFASAVAWKEYGGYAPTRCSKLKIYRPKTGVEKRVIENINEGPCSVSSFDKRWRFIRKTKVTPMDLAICWDMLPVNPWDEPKRDMHIDGSNGSSAPAVFQLVQNPQYKPSRSTNNKGLCCQERRPYTAIVPSAKVQEDVPRVHSAYYEREERRYQSCPCLGKCQGVGHANSKI
ncbi:uncharacterized protein LOC108741808 [Agrilus planipennis]|uniref:Uncharacterized protein LOC108741808 n=1 Tax=Agrilus planipennis TaxID=224129 RepID=A0A1W4XHL9_AGRPL|nr:uncharacterized protein LOC108741808 [Agrilus planipennis]